MRENNRLSVRITSQSQHSACDRPPGEFPSPRRRRRRCVLLFLTMTFILRILKKLAAPPTRLICILQLMLLTVRTTTSCPPPHQPRHEHAPRLRCVYLQAVPCDPAGADFNFAALSFNSEFLHQIHLVPLHPPGVSADRYRAAVGGMKGVGGGGGLKEEVF